MNKNVPSKKRLTSDGTGPFVFEDSTVLASLSGPAQILMVGFSFSMTKYSDPCLYNYDIRDAMKADLNVAAKSSKQPFMFVQWEIADAILDDPGFPAGMLQPDHVCEPHIISPEQILKPHVLLAQILAADASASSPPGILKTKLEQLWQESGVRPPDLAAEQENSLRERLAKNLNGLLADPDFWRDFSGVLTLKNLPRTVRGRVWTEKRELPPRTATVRKYQGRRLGAFVIEAVFGDALLTPTEYISTRSVLDSMMEQARGERFIPEYICLYAHQAHALPRARWQAVEKIWSATRETMWRPDWLLSPDRVVYRGGSDRWGQPDNAQDWTDSPENWNAYNGIEAAR